VQTTAQARFEILCQELARLMAATAVASDLDEAKQRLHHYLQTASIEPIDGARRLGEWLKRLFVEIPKTSIESSYEPYEAFVSLWQGLERWLAVQSAPELVPFIHVLMDIDIQRLALHAVKHVATDTPLAVICGIYVAMMHRLTHYGQTFAGHMATLAARLGDMYATKRQDSVLSFEGAKPNHAVSYLAWSWVLAEESGGVLSQEPIRQKLYQQLIARIIQSWLRHQDHFIADFYSDDSDLMTQRLQHYQDILGCAEQWHMDTQPLLQLLESGLFNKNGRHYRWLQLCVQAAQPQTTINESSATVVSKINVLFSQLLAFQRYLSSGCQQEVALADKLAEALWHYGHGNLDKEAVATIYRRELSPEHWLLASELRDPIHQLLLPSAMVSPRSLSSVNAVWLTRLVDEPLTMHRMQLLTLQNQLLAVASQDLAPAAYQTRRNQFSHQIAELLNNLLTPINDWLGPAPCAFSLLRLGSGGRREDVGYSDIEFMLVFKPETSKLNDATYMAAIRTYFEVLLALFHWQILLLHQSLDKTTVLVNNKTQRNKFIQNPLNLKLGFHFDEGGHVATPFHHTNHCVVMLADTVGMVPFCLPETDWQVNAAVLPSTFEALLNRTEPTVLTVSALWDAQHLHGDPDVSAAYQTRIQQILHTHGAFGSATAPQTRPIHELWGLAILHENAKALDLTRIRADDVTMGIKAALVQPISQAIKGICCYMGLYDAKHTTERIEALHAAGLLPRAVADGLCDYWLFLDKLRIKAQGFYGWDYEEVSFHEDEQRYVLTLAEQRQLWIYTEQVAKPFFKTVTAFKAWARSDTPDPALNPWLHPQRFKALLTYANLHEPSLTKLDFLAQFPKPDGTRPADWDAMQKREQFQLALLGIAATYPVTSSSSTSTSSSSSSFSSAPPVYVRWIDEQGHHREIILAEAVAKDLLDANGVFNKAHPHRAQSAADRVVIPHKLSAKESRSGVEVTLFFKAYPEYPGLQMLANEVGWRISGYGLLSVFTQFWISDKLYYPVQISMEIPGLTVRHHRITDPNLSQIEARLSPYYYTLAFLERIGLLPEDDQDANIVAESLEQSNTAPVRLTTVDYDHIFETPTVVRSQGKMQAAVKSLVFCFDQAQRSLDRTAIAIFSTLDIELLVRQSLAALAQWDRAAAESGVYQHEEHYFSTYKSFIRMALQPGDIAKLQYRLKTLQQGLHELPYISGLALMQSVDVLLGRAYNLAFTSRYRSPLGRLMFGLSHNTTIETRPVSARHAVLLTMPVIPVMQSSRPHMYHSLQPSRLSLWLTQPKRDFEALIRAKAYLLPGDYIDVHTGQVLGELIRTPYPNQDNAVIRDCILVHTTQFLSQPLDWQEHVVNEQLDWSAYTLAEQKQLLQVLMKVPFQQLRLRGCQVLKKDYSLGDGITFTDFFASQPGLLSLELRDIRAVPGITAISGTDLSQLPTLCPHLQKLALEHIDTCQTLVFAKAFLALRSFRLSSCAKVSELHLPAPRLQQLIIADCQLFTHGQAILSVISRETQLDVWRCDMLWSLSQSIGSRSNQTYFSQLAANRYYGRYLKQIMPAQIRPLISQQKWLEALHAAAFYGYNETINHLVIYQQADVNACKQTGRTALMLAAANGQIHTLDWLIQHGANLHKQDRRGYTALMYAASKGSDVTMQHLMTAHHLDIQARDKDGHTLLMLAVMQHDVATVDRLIKHGADVHLQNDAGQTALMLAAARGYTDIIDRLAKCGAGVEVRDNQGHTALMLAAMHGHHAAIECLQGYDADVHARNQYDETACLLAVREGHEVCADLLIKPGVDIEVRDNKGNTAVLLAALHGHISLLHRLVTHCQGNVQVQDPFGNTALMSAVLNGRMDMMRCLITLHADVNKQDHQGMTALMFAVLKGDVDAVNDLIQYGADVHIQNSDGYTALMLAARQGNNTMVDYLVRTHRVNMDARYQQGNTMLMLAASQGDIATMRCLLRQGARIDATNAQGETALMLAADQGQAAAMDCLKAFGADLRVRDNTHKTVWDRVLASAHSETLKEEMAVVLGIQCGTSASIPLSSAPNALFTSPSGGLVPAVVVPSPQPSLSSPSLDPR